MIQLYITSIEKLTNKEIFVRKLSQVSEERRQKIHTCKVQKDKERSLSAGLLLTYAWESFLRENGEETEVLQIISGENGKPVCGNREDFFYNLSHSGEYVICGVAREPIGADIQLIKDKEMQLKVAKRFFLPEECEQLEKSTDKAQTFCQMWAMKESYIKYTGQGISQGLNTFSVDPSSGKIYDHVTDKSYYVNLYEELPGYEIAVCTAQQQEMIVQKIEIVQ